MSDQPVPRWKFWHPLPFWQVVVVCLLANLAVGLVLGALSIATELSFGGAAVGAGGSLLAYLTIFALARRKAAALASGQR